jgi:hypothetical protein
LFGKRTTTTLPGAVPSEARASALTQVALESASLMVSKANLSDIFVVAQ